MEGALHAQFLAHWGESVGASAAAAHPSPACLLYTSWVLACVHERAFYEGARGRGRGGRDVSAVPCVGWGAALLAAAAAHYRSPRPTAPAPTAPAGPGLAAVLPCFAVYLEVGKALKAQGEGGPRRGAALGGAGVGGGGGGAARATALPPSHIWPSHRPRRWPPCLPRLPCRRLPAPLVSGVDRQVRGGRV